MGYDMQTQNITSLHSSLYDNYTDSKVVAHFSSNKAVELLFSFGVPASKITLLCPAYARVADDVKPGELIGSQCSDAGAKHYKEIPELVAKGQLQESTLYGTDVDGNKVAAGACATALDKKTFYSYDNPKSMKAKVNYSQKLDLGFGIWKLEADAHVGCGSLLECVLVERANAHRTTEPGL
jgi:GH18 family chitinase